MKLEKICRSLFTFLREAVSSSSSTSSTSSSSSSASSSSSSSPVTRRECSAGFFSVIDCMALLLDFHHLVIYEKDSMYGAGRR